ncbi:ribonuclease H-like domain-containing protein [Mycena belliarum]|uniref:Ribonuclease H-like domain-containing protein n=1 Tax=Mycena belliarum TaxID=1033014 RepID=A0AAD6XPB2_9AGAR|nr:ribonuclease H-like domain-containing protein [Mycena belliae]KAJ7092998.1 ribonuclease H-like domain-containing protein [Mycena belliae]KAJ7093002.1 ribonuclease H-like domain-containing protein [Mycena belliae]KAJ7093257.1 ribonuclease H-like domain-containing protein [Mycena belliae]
MASIVLKDVFHRADTMQNSTHWRTHCKACVAHHLDGAGAPVDTVIVRSQAFHDACKAVGEVRGEKTAWIAHLIGGKGTAACSHASADVKAAAAAERAIIKAAGKRPRTDSSAGAEPAAKKRQPALEEGQAMLKTFQKNQMPYSPSEKAAFQHQSLRAIVSGGLPLGAFEDLEMKILFGMMRTTAPAIMPTGKVIGGRLLNSAAHDVEEKNRKALKNKNAGLLTDGWKAKNKDSINGLCATVDYKMIDRVEVKYGCIIIYFITDADGGSKKGRILLGRERPWLFLPSCWAHQFQLILGDYFKVNDMAAGFAEEATGLIGWINNHGKVRKIFDESQATISKDRNGGKIIVLAYLVANMTRWTTHFVAFRRLFSLRPALQLGVLQKRAAIIAAEVGAATSTEATRLEEEAIKFCTLIEDASFWSGLETVLGDLEPICLGTNINQKDSTRLDQVLLTLAGIFLRFADHPEKEVQDKMVSRLEKRWKDCDQPIFLLALVLNPFEKLSCFGPRANLNHLKCRNLLISVYRRINSRPDNQDTAEEKNAKEAAVSKAFMQYLSGTGDFGDFDAEEWEEINKNVNPIQVWEALGGSCELTELAEFAVIILTMVANQAAVERSFSRTKIEQSDHRNRLGVGKLDKRVKVHAQIRSEQLRKPREGRKNHKSLATLLDVPRYRDLLDDQGHEDSAERGRALVSSETGWRTQMAKWIGEAREAERTEVQDLEEDVAEDVEDAPRIAKRLPIWQPTTLKVLFGGAAKPRTRKASVQVMEEEEILMEALAEQAEDDIPDDGGIEIHSDDEYRE